jgi:mannose-6-phosphate isomerase-like protein (cupin superfamily)
VSRVDHERRIDMKSESIQPYLLPHDRGVTDVWFPSSPLGLGRYSIKVSAAQSEGRLFQMHERDVRGAAPPMHTHAGDETLYIINGEVSVFLGDERLEAGAGSFVMVPKRSLHSWLVRSEEAELLVTLAPAGLEGFFTEFGVPVVPGAPKPDLFAIDPEKSARRADAYGLEFLGPPPTLD